VTDALALQDPGGRRLQAIGRYKKATSRKFRELCAQVDEGPTFSLIDEVETLRTMLANLLSVLCPDDDDLATDNLYLRLLESKFPIQQAKQICTCVDAFGSTKDITLVMKELRETLKMAAEFEGMIPAARVRAFVAEFLRVVKEEVKDDKIVERIGRKTQTLSL